MSREEKEKLYNVSLVSEAYMFFDNSFGNVVPFEKIKADAGSYSSVFCEGSVALRTLLKDLWAKGIETKGCCIGHETVHLYIKESIFGKRDYIDEKTYLSHKKSKRYKHVETQGHAYLAFRPGDLGPSDEFLRSLINGLNKELPELSYDGEAFPELVTISLTEYVAKDKREAFFTALEKVIFRDILHDLSPVLSVAEDLPEKAAKQPLEAKIRAAETIKKEQGLRQAEKPHMIASKNSPERS